MASFGSIKQAIFNKEAKKQQYQDHIRGLNAYDRHKKFLNDYASGLQVNVAKSRALFSKSTTRTKVDSTITITVGYYGKEKSSRETLPVKTDQDTLREGYRFIRTEEDDRNSSWEQRLVKRYYDKLFKEYCLADMSQYKTGKIGLRWRTEKEVISGKGQFECGNKHCNQNDGLSSYEVNFSYFEAGENKQALVKLVACERCAEKLYYKKWKEEERLKQKENGKHQKKRGRSESNDDKYSYDGRSKESRKGKMVPTSAGDYKPDDDDNFDEYLEGMFP